MMQSLLLNATANIKNNDSKAYDDKEIRANDYRSSKLADRQKNFARVMQDNINKENVQAKSRHVAKTSENNRVNRTDDRPLNAMENADKKEPKAGDTDAPIESHLEKTSARAKKHLDKIEANKTSESRDYDEKKVDDETSLEESVTESEDASILNADALILDEALTTSVNATEKTDSAEAEPLEFTVEVDEESKNTDLTDDDLSLMSLVSEGVNSMNEQLNDNESSKEETRLLSEDITDSDIVLTNEEANIDNTLDESEEGSLLSQIEAAHKADTNVNKTDDDSSDLTDSTEFIVDGGLITKPNTEKNTTPLMDQIEPEVEGDITAATKVTLDADAKMNAGKLGVMKEGKLEVDADSEIKLKTMPAQNGVEEAELTSDVDSTLQEVKQSEKTEAFATHLKTELSTAAPVVDVNGAKPNLTSQVQLDKLVAFNQQAPASNNLLHEPLDIHSKHAAAMIGERVMMMISQGKQEVQIRLDPAELGSMFIKMQVQQDQVQLHIQTQAGLSKDIIEQNMPRLREQLAQQGIQLSEANVQQQSQQQSQQQRHNQVNSAVDRGINGQELVADQKTVFIPSKIPSSEQGIDYYA